MGVAATSKLFILYKKMIEILNYGISHIGGPEKIFV